MKKIFIAFLAIILSLKLLAQENKTFDSEHLSFSYPSKYKTISIENAPHMLLKLESNNELFSISEGRLEFNATDVWDDKFYEIYKKSLAQQECISLEKVSIRIQSGIKHFLKSKINHTSNGLKMLTYISIHDGYMYVFGHLSSGAYDKYAPTKEVDDLIKGVYFKDSYNPNDDSTENNLNFEKD